MDEEKIIICPHGLIELKDRDEKHECPRTRMGRCDCGGEEVTRDEYEKRKRDFLRMRPAFPGLTFEWLCSNLRLAMECTQCGFTR
jgi:hypothetical protein